MSKQPTKRVWRRTNTYGLWLIGFCCGVAITAAVMAL
jgi:hypothetical protein